MALARSPNVRLFIALWPGERVRGEIVRWQSRWTWPPHASLVKPDRLHITLHFIGDVSPERVLDLKYVLRRVASQGFELRLGRPDMWQYGTAVLRPENSPTALRALHARIGLALAQLALAVEDRPFLPHVTLARRAGGATPPAQPPQVEWVSKGGFVLVRTLPGGRGYETLEKFGD